MENQLSCRKPAFIKIIYAARSVAAHSFSTIAVLVTVFLAPALFTSPAKAQECQTEASPAQDKSRFDINENGTVTDIESGLTWSRCVAGQTWDGKTCTGEARLLSWSEAQQYPQQLHDQRNDSAAWRLPKLNELAGIVDMNCDDPRIDLSLFPNTAGDAFWTSNTKKYTEQVYVLSFGRQGVSSVDKTEKHYVRLVYGRD